MQFHPDWAPQTGGERIYDSAIPMIPDGEPGLPTPLIYDVSEPALRLRELSFAAKRLVDMQFVSGHSRDEAMRRLVWRGMPHPGGLAGKPDAGPRLAALTKAVAGGQIAVHVDEAARSVTVTWTDPSLGATIAGSAAAPPGWGGTVLGSARQPRFKPSAIPRAAKTDAPWPIGGAVEAAGLTDAGFQRAVDAFFAASPGTYGLLVATPERVLFERYGNGGAADRATPSWSMNKSLTGTLIGRMIHLGWLNDVYAPARPPLWRDPRGIHASITLDNLLHMRSGLAMPMFDEHGGAGLGFENSAVYFDGEDAFDAAQRNIVATRPGAAFRYINAGINVLGAVIRDRIESRGLPYQQTVYELLADRIGMHSYQASGDIAGNLIASGSAFATLRDFAKMGVLYLNDGVWNGERLLPPGWVDYALAATHVGCSYAGTFWTNSDRRFPALPPDAAWMSGASDQRVFVLRDAQRVVAVTNETDAPMDLAALNSVLAAVLTVA